ncbi:MAG TPA: hypothetical protein VIF15_11160 [Polyangiaceae bacterium]
MMPRKSDRPTVPPSFDVEQYAKDSDARMATVPRVEPDEEPQAEAEVVCSSEMRLMTRREMGAAVTNDAWARSMTGTPVVALSGDRLRRLPLDHRAGFLLSLMDGTIDLETLISIAAMPRDDVLRTVRDLFESGVVEFR